MNFTPVFKSKKGDISYLKYANGIGSVFAMTFSGVINRLDSFPSNLFGRGLSYIFSQIENGEGDLSDPVDTSIYYDLYHMLISLNGTSEEFTPVKENVEIFSTSKNSKVTAIYISDVLKADEDFGFWKNITWKQTVSSARIVVALKVAETEEELLKLKWQYYISETPSEGYGSPHPSEYVVIKDLDRFNLKGRYMQFKVELETDSAFVNPIVSEFIITYAAKHAVFFFTRKIKIDRTTNLDNIILTANYSEPENTEIRFGLANSNTANWQDYKIVNLDELITLPSNWGSILKVGIKLSSYSDTKYPVIQEFAFLLGTDSDNKLNET